MDTTQKQRGSMWALGLVVVGIYFAPSLLRFFAAAALHPLQGSSAKAGLAKSPPGSPASNTGAAGAPGSSANGTGETPPVLADDPALAKFLGKWEGSMALPSRGTCFFKLEVKDNHDREHPFAGYSSLSCAPTMFELLDKGESGKQTPAGMIDYMAKQMNPTSAILAGARSGDSVQFEVQMNVGVKELRHGCGMSSLSIAPFGTNQVAVDWKESQQGLCQGGQIVLRKEGT